MSSYIPLHVHSDASFDAFSKPQEIAERIIELGLPGCALTDHGNIANAIKFHKAMTSAKLKPILGCEFYISDGPSTEKTKENRSCHHLVILAKNYAGWKTLIKMINTANTHERFYHRPRLDISDLKNLADGNIIAISGHPGSYFCNVLFSDLSNAFNSGNVAEVKQFLNPGWKQLAIDATNVYGAIFGWENFYLEIQLMDQARLPMQVVIAECLREIAGETGVLKAATPDAHYLRKTDAVHQRVIICNHLKTTMDIVSRKFAEGEDVGLGGFFQSDNYHIPSTEEMQQWHTADELENTIKIFDMCEEYSIKGEAALPKLVLPDGKTDDEYLRELCRIGWEKRIKNRIPKHLHAAYTERIKYELEILQGADLSSYFLIMADITKFCRSKGWLTGIGRGSAAGCLVSYLTYITQINPIQYNLSFERFYSAARKGSMPDIDLDVPDIHRDEVIDYLKQKYGSERVCQIITFSKIKGRSGIKEVLRAWGGISFEEMNRISDFVPDEAEITDDLQEMKEDDGESSIVRWALENNADKLKGWCFINEKNEFEGPLAERFRQAIILEGRIVSSGKHASGIVIAPINLAEICPMVYDTKTKTQIAGFEMKDLEEIGLVKFDILGLAALSKLQGIQKLLAVGEI